MSRKLRPLAALAMVALIGVGCSNGSTGSSGNDSTNRDASVKFAECMRTNGVKEFPDPNASGDFAYGIELGTSLDPSSAVWKKAVGACKSLQPPGFMSTGKQSDETMKARLKFAACMRENGVKEFPDPTPDGPLINVQGARSIPGFQDALQKCRVLLPGGGLGGK